MSRKFSYIFFIIIVFVACKSPEARKPVQYNSGTYFKKSAERNKAIFEKEKQQIIQLLESKKGTTYYTSEEGFWYFYNKKDSLATLTPNYGDHVTFTYQLNYLNGTQILSEKEIGLQNYKIDQTNQELISGIRDGLKLMKQGEVATFYFPSYNAYGYYGIENKLGSNVPIECKITLITINKNK